MREIKVNCDIYIRVPDDFNGGDDETRQVVNETIDDICHDFSAIDIQVWDGDWQLREIPDKWSPSDDKKTTEPELDPEIFDVDKWF